MAFTYLVLNYGTIYIRRSRTKMLCISLIVNYKRYLCVIIIKQIKSYYQYHVQLFCRTFEYVGLFLIFDCHHKFNLFIAYVCTSVKKSYV